MLKLVRMEELQEPAHQPDLRRPAAARGAGPRAGAAAEGAAARRAAVGARLQAAQGHADRAEAAAARDRHHLHLRHPRPGRSADHVGPHRGHVGGQDPAGRLARATSTTARPSASSPTSSARPISSTAEIARRRERQRPRCSSPRGADDRGDAARRVRRRQARSPSWCGPSMPAVVASPARRDAAAARSRTSSISAPTRISMCSLDGGGEFIVRQQNTRGGDERLRDRRPGRHRDRRRRRAGAEGLSDGEPPHEIAEHGRSASDVRDRWLLSAPALHHHPLRRDRAAADRAGLFLPDARPPMAASSGSSRPTAGSQRPLRARHLRRHAVASPTRICRSSGARSSCRLLTTLLTLLFGFPDRLFHRHAAGADARHLAVPDHHPVLDQPPDPHLRDPGGDPQRRHHQHAAAASSASSTRRSRSCSPTSPSCSAWSMSTCR